MATYIIGDVQGCFDELQALLDHIHFDEKKDHLGFVGDLVSRGPKSLETLRFVKNLPKPLVVLGNHDLHCLALGYGVIQRDQQHSLNAIITAADKDELLFWLRQQALMHIEPKKKFALVHAGIPPQWSINTANSYAEEIKKVLCGPSYREYLTQMYGDQPDSWSDQLTGWDRIRYITNALTRLRFCSEEGQLDVTNKTEISSNPKKFKPWFEWLEPECDIIFGHWAALGGHCHKPRFYALDTGCVWGGKLTALRIEDKKLFSINAFQQYHSVNY